MLEIRDLVCGYGHVNALRGLTIDVREGQLVALVGANGAGKSTTLRAISGLVKARSGAIRFKGRDITKAEPRRILGQGIAHCPEGRRVFPQMTVAENLAMGAYLRRDRAGIAADRERVYGEFPRLAERRDQAAGTLSGGEQQMLAIGRALMTNPHLLVLDEATEGLAPLVREEIWRCLARLRAGGQSILVIDKYVQRLVALADTHTIVQRGRVVWQGDSAALAAQPALWQTYIGV